jgi:hypothetical protein
MKKLLTLAATAAALALTTGTASATTFLGDYTVTAINSADPGLKVFATDLPGAINLNLPTVGSTQSVALFNLWTDEGSVNLGEDTVAKPISVLFNFTAPSSFNGTVTGTTVGIFGFFEKGHVTWTGPVDMNFGSGGVLRVSLNDADFNKGAFFGLDEGEKDGATITGKFKLISNAVPEPGTWALMITGFGLVGATIRRRRALGVAA